MRTFLAAALLLVTVLAGCAGGGDNDEPTESAEPTHDDLAVGKPVVLLLNVTIGNATYRFTSDDLASSRPAASSSSSTVTVSSTNSTTGAANATGPAGNATGNDTATPSGPAPLNVTFELGALQLTNRSGLRWSLGAEPVGAAATGNSSAGNGTATGMTLPATVDRTYNATGSYQVTYSLQSGNKTLDSLDVTIIVSNGTGSVQAPVDIPFSAEGTIVVGTQGPDACGAADSVDVAEHPWDLSAVASITKIVVHMEIGTTNLDSDIFLYDPAGEEVGSSVDFNVITQSPTEDFEVEGPLAPGIYSFVVRGCMGVEAEYSITATASALA